MNNCTFINGTSFNSTNPCYDYEDDYDNVWQTLIFMGIIVICFCLIICPIREHCLRNSSNRSVEVIIRENREREVSPLVLYIDYTKKIISIIIPPKNQGMCVICLDELINEENKKLGKLNNCTHVFHMKCLNTWLNEKPICPVCRRDVI